MDDDDESSTTSPIVRADIHLHDPPVEEEVEHSGIPTPQLNPKGIEAPGLGVMLLFHCLKNFFADVTPSVSSSPGKLIKCLTAMGCSLGTFEVCVLTHIALRMFIMQVLASQLYFLHGQ